MTMKQASDAGQTATTQRSSWCNVMESKYGGMQVLSLGNAERPTLRASCMQRRASAAMMSGLAESWTATSSAWLLIACQIKQPVNICQSSSNTQQWDIQQIRTAVTRTCMGKRGRQPG